MSRTAHATATAATRVPGLTPRHAARSYAVVGSMVLLGSASGGTFPSNIADSAVEAFLGLLVLLLAAMLIAVMRLPPYQPRSSADELEPPYGAAGWEEPRMPAADPRGLPPRGQRIPPGAQHIPPGAGRIPMQRQYGPRHGLSRDAIPEQEIRPRSTGGPPWGPAPKPPGVG